MTRKTKAKAKTKTKQKKATPFADAGQIVGQRLGNWFQMPMLKGVGKWLGSGIGSIFGSGDYQITGPQAGYNVLSNGGQIPKFKSDDRTNIICHREHVRDIYGTDSFNNISFDINPINDDLFPWLATVANCYQEYRIHGMIVEFRSLMTDFVTDGKPGVIVFATNYNSADPAFGSKVEMENTEFAVSVKPTTNLVHMIECDPGQTPMTKLYVGTPGAQDPRLYNLGKLQVATQGNPNQLIGELWVSYCIEFFKPRLPKDVSGVIKSARVIRSSITGVAPLGLIGVSITGDLTVTCTSTTLTIYGVRPNELYLFTAAWSGEDSVAWNYVAYPTLSGCTITSPENYNYANFVPEAGNTVRRVNHTTYMCVDKTNTNGYVSIAFPTGGAWPATSTSLTIFVTQMSSQQ